jgi:hypothetical protein
VLLSAEKLLAEEPNDARSSVGKLGGLWLFEAVLSIGCGYSCIQSDCVRDKFITRFECSGVVLRESLWSAEKMKESATMPRTRQSRFTYCRYGHKVSAKALWMLHAIPNDKLTAFRRDVLAHEYYNTGNFPGTTVTYHLRLILPFTRVWYVQA